jgi:hypothetical protein
MPGSRGHDGVQACMRITHDRRLPASDAAPAAPAPPGPGLYGTSGSIEPVARRSHPRMAQLSHPSSTATRPDPSGTWLSWRRRPISSNFVVSGPGGQRLFDPDRSRGASGPGGDEASSARPAHRGPVRGARAAGSGPHRQRVPSPRSRPVRGRRPQSAARRVRRHRRTRRTAVVTRYTAPIPPTPSRLSTSYRPAMVSPARRYLDSTGKSTGGSGAVVGGEPSRITSV